MLRRSSGIIGWTDPVDKTPDTLPTPAQGQVPTVVAAAPAVLVLVRVLVTSHAIAATPDVERPDDWREPARAKDR